jgi:hypothetical protein
MIAQSVNGDACYEVVAAIVKKIGPYIVVSGENVKRLAGS